MLLSILQSKCIPSGILFVVGPFSSVSVTLNAIGLKTFPNPQDVLSSLCNTLVATDFDLTSLESAISYFCMDVWLIFIFPVTFGAPLCRNCTSSPIIISPASWDKLDVSLFYEQMNKHLNLILCFQISLFRYKSSFSISPKLHDWKNMWFLLANVYILKMHTFENYLKLSFLHHSTRLLDPMSLIIQQDNSLRKMPLLSGLFSVSGLSIPMCVWG